MQAHYAVGYEERRLLAGAGRLEWLRTMEIIERYAPSPPASVLDVGGGAGAYALPLAARAYQVHLVDPVPLHVEQARAASQRAAAPLASAELGDARQLACDDASVELLLLLGPLYHLTEAEDRRRALQEAFRVLRPGEVMLASGISRFASTCDGLRQGYLRDAAFEAIVERDLATGQHRNATHEPGWFTTAFFHRPDELATEVRAAGFTLEGLFAVEGPAWLLAGLDEWLASAAETEGLLRAIRRIETESSLIGASAHFLAVGRKP